MPNRRRTLARELALQSLYQVDVSATTETPIRRAEELDAFLQENSQDIEVRAYARTLIHGAMEMQEALDRRIALVAENWKLNRIASIDRCILRLALYELLESDDVPPKVAINEAIEMAKRFSTSQSGGFVNGVLDRAYRQMVAEFSDGAESADNDDSSGS